MSVIPDQQDYEPILEKGKHPNISRTVKVHKSQLAEWEKLKSARNQDFKLSQIYNYICQLGGIADQRDDKVHQLSRPTAELTYRFDGHGDVYLSVINIINQQNVTQQKSGIYDVAFGFDAKDEENKWLTENNPLQEPELTQTLESKHRIAVGGKPFENKEEVGELPINHLVNAYRTNPHTVNAVDNRYSLVWLNSGFSSDKSVNLVSDIIFNTARKNESLAWPGSQ